MSSIKGYVLDCGRINGPKSAIIADAKPDETQEIPVYSVFLKHPEGNVLFDAGLHRDEKRQAPFIFNSAIVKDEDNIVKRLAGIGVSPEDINYIVLSHMHADHSGYIEKFPNAEICISEREFTYAIKDYALGTNQDSADIEYWIECKLKWKLIPDTEKEFELFPGITILNFGPGHSFGMLGLLISFEKAGKVILTADTCYMRQHIEPPRAVSGIVHNADGYNSTLDRIAELAEKENAQIWFGHDLEQFNSLTKSTEGFYE